MADGTVIPAHPKPHVDAFVLDRILDRGDIAQIDRRAARAADDQVAVLFGGFQLTLRPKHRRARRAVQLSRAGVAGAVLDRSAEIVNRNSARPHRRRIGLDANRRLGAEDVYLRDARQNADALAHLRARIIVELPGVTESLVIAMYMIG